MEIRLLSLLPPNPASCRAWCDRRTAWMSPAANRSSVPWVRKRAARTQAVHATDSDLLSVEEVQQVAAARGICLSLKTLGPFYRIVCREGDEGGKVLGVTSGFIITPLGLMHCDTLQIFTKGLKGVEGERIRGGVLGLGLLMGASVFAFGNAAGCKKAEILAINDDDATHARLVRYYQRFGFSPVYEVTGSSLADLPHMLVWGGVGTRLDADVQQMVKRWTAAVRQSARGQSAPAAPHAETVEQSPS